tara:strand:- start:6161 stop:6640 length:480 start_codon:yes stop_codon:yes gene_type:complete
MTPNELFLRFALPCLKYLEIPKPFKQDIKDKFFSGDYLPQSHLEETYPVACHRMSTTMGKDWFTVKEIWRHYLLWHNRLVKESAKVPENIYWCQVRFGEVEKTIGNKIQVYYPCRDSDFDLRSLFHNDYKVKVAKKDIVVLHDKHIIDLYSNVLKLLHK